MKKILKTFMAAAVTAVVLIHSASAQLAVRGSLGSDVPGLSTFNGDEQKDKNALSGIHPRAVKDFEKSFKSITDENWSKLSDGYIASFTADSIKTRVAYNRNGRWQYTMLYYGEKKLPLEVRSAVKSVYYDYDILNVAEIYLDNQPLYMITIQDETHLKTIGVYDGDMQVIQEYQRG
ncbi:MAG TPA: hypothetical protein VH396_02490 [Chitinophagaceae bacterium]